MNSRARTLDQYFTPPELAAKLISYVTLPTPNRIGDFAAGDGQLLRAAENRWPGIKCTAIDIDELVLDKLKSTHPKWSAACGDFTNTETRNRILIKGGKLLRLPAIVLNPPFSISDGKVRVRTVTIGGNTVRCSPALAFVVDAIQYLKRRGQLVAIVPHSVIQSQKDATALKLLSLYHAFEIVEHVSRARFSKCTPRTAIIRLTAGAGISPTPQIAEPYLTPVIEISTRISRGTISNTTVIHSVHEDSLPFLHTTDLSKGVLHKPSKNIYQSNLSTVSGPAVLLPRVGKPNFQKIALLPARATAVISDCVIAIECKTENDAEALQMLLIKQWPYLEQAYAGTCARYISLGILRSFLQKLGCELHTCAQVMRSTKPADGTLIQVMC